MSQLMFPDIVGQYRQGVQYGQQQAANKLAGQVYGADPTQRQPLLSQLAALNPQMAVGLGSTLASQDAAQAKQTQMTQADHAAKLNKAANFMLQQVQTGDPARIQGAYQAVRPYLAELSGQQPPDQFDQSMIPHLYQILGQTGGMPDPKTFNVSPGGKVVDISGRVIADNPTQPHDSGEVATIKALQSDPTLLATYRQMHPRAVSVSGGMGRAPMGYRWNKDGSALEPIPGGPADSSGTGQGLTSDAIQNAAWSYIGTGKLPPIGRGKEGVAQRTAIMNETAKIAKDAGISPAELQTVPGRNRALQSSLTAVQKRADAMNAAEEGFLNNTKTALDISEGLDRFNSPVINRWYLGGKDAMGDPQVHALDAAIRAMATDYARIMSGATGAGGTPISTTEDAIKLIRKDLSDKSLRAVVDVLNQDIEGQRKAVHDTRGNILGAMQQLHDASAPGMMPNQAAAQPASPAGWSIEVVQ